MGVLLRLDLCLGQEHEVKPPAFHCPDGLYHSKAPAIPDIDCPDGNPGRALGSGARQRRQRVQAVGAMEDW